MGNEWNLGGCPFAKNFAAFRYYYRITGAEITSAPIFLIKLNF